MRIPVIDARGVQLMPCTQPKARILLKEGKAHGLRNKLGLFYLQLTYEQQPDNQRLVVGIDPGSKFEGYSVVGLNTTVLNLMVEAPTHIVHRRQLHRLKASKGGVRKPYGGTRSQGLKRGTLVRHPTYGLCTVGGCNRKKHTISLHKYRSNERLTQGATVQDCQ